MVPLHFEQVARRSRRPRTVLILYCLGSMRELALQRTQ
jgi:hypothetical protein